MLFQEAWALMKKGKKVKREKWGGYWALEDERIVMHCHDGTIMDLRMTKDTIFTVDNIVADDWVVAEKKDIHIHNGKKAMLSQPMGNVPELEILDARARAMEDLEDMGYETIDTLFTDEWYEGQKAEEHGVVNRGLFFLAKSLEEMSKCNTVYMCKHWDGARGCRIEHAAANEYGLEVLYEEEPEPPEEDEEEYW